MCKFTLKKRNETSLLGRIRDLTIDNISAKVRGTTTITGHIDQPLENIRMSNVRLLMDTENAKDKRASDAIRIDTVKGLKLRDVSVEWNDNETEPAWQSALVLKNISDFTVDGFSGRQGLKDKDSAAIRVENCVDGIVRNCSAINGTATFIYVAGSGTKDVVVKDNRTAKAKKPFTFENKLVEKSVIIDK